MKQSKLIKFLSIFVSCGLLLPTVAMADSAELLTMVQNLQSEMAEMKQTIKWQGGKIQDLQKGSTLVETKNGDTAKVITEDSHPWLKGLKQSGDFRLRYEGTRATGGSAPADRNRFRYRLRWGVEKEMAGPFEGDKMKVGFRVASAPGDSVSSTRNSTNETFDDQFDFKDIAIDRAYAKYYPGALKDLGPISKTEITAGKFKNPFLSGSTWMMWDSDVTPEGIYEKFDLNLLKSEDIDLTGELTLGQFVVEENAGSDNADSELFAGQFVVNSKLKGFGDDAIKTKHAISYYHYDDYTTAGNFVAGNNATCGTALCAGDFKVLDIYNEIGITIPGTKLPFKVYQNFFKNLDESAVTKASGAGQDKAWMLGAKIGKAKKKGTWELKYEYAWIEANSTPGAFTDSDFGGTDRRGSVLKGKYALTDNLSFAMAYFATNRITTGTFADTETDLWQMDMAWKF